MGFCVLKPLPERKENEYVNSAQCIPSFLGRSFELAKREQGVTNRSVENLASFFGWLVPSMAIVVILITFLMSVLVVSGILT